MVKAVRDPTSDMAITSRKGSDLVRSVRERKEKMKVAKDAFKLAGTNLGNILRVDKEAEDKMLEDNTNVATTSDLPGDVDDGRARKNESQFATHLKKANAVSAFAKSKTMREQREFLPIFAVRDELLRIIRDNPIVVIVGEV